ALLVRLCRSQETASVPMQYLSTLRSIWPSWTGAVASCARTSMVRYLPICRQYCLAWVLILQRLQATSEEGAATSHVPWERSNGYGPSLSDAATVSPKA